MKTNKDKKQTEFEKYLNELVSEKGINLFHWDKEDFSILGDFMDKEKHLPVYDAYVFTGEYCDQ